MSRAVHSINPVNIVLSLWLNRRLVWQMTRREVVGRYRGSVLGLFWSFAHPLLMLAVYTVVFGVIFPIRTGGASHVNLADYSIFLFAGLMMHSFFSECINAAPSLMIANVNFVKKVVFPLEVLPWISLLSALFHLLMSVLVLLLCYLFFNHQLHWTVFYLPLLIAPLALVMIGVGWFLAALGVFLRDVGQGVGILSTAMLFLSPILYSLQSVPEKFRMLFYLNPLTFIIDQTRLVLLQGQAPDWYGLAIYSLFGAMIAWLGFAFFQKTRMGFADVL